MVGAAASTTPGLPAPNNGFLSYDNLFYPGGSPQTASDYPFRGGCLDIYGLMFSIGGGRVVNTFWSNGDFSVTGSGPIDTASSLLPRTWRWIMSVEAWPGS